MNKTGENAICALLWGEFAEERVLLHEIFRKPGWRLFEAGDRRKALQCLERNPVQVVIADSAGHNWSWKSVLQDLRRLALPPQLLVAARQADDSLWAEVLNFGAYDLLARPLVREEVERVVESARRHFHAPPRRANQAQMVLSAPAGAA